MRLPYDGPANRRLQRLNWLTYAVMGQLGAWTGTMLLTNLHGWWITAIYLGVGGFTWVALKAHQREWKRIKAQWKDQEARHFLALLSGRKKGTA